MDKIKKIIIGGGFSSFAVHAYVKDCIVCSSDINQTNYKLRNNISINKLFHNFKSYGSLIFNIKQVKLHDYPLVGGNSNLWGGYIFNDIPKQFISFLKKNNIYLQKLSFPKTGSCSNKNINQLRQNNFTLNIRKQKHITKNHFIHLIECHDNKIFIYTDELNKIEVTDNLYLTCGVVQLLDLLYRSKFIKDKSTISLDEYQYSWRLAFTFKKNYFNYKKNETVIRHNLLVAIKHYLGIQKNFNITRLFNNFPVYIDQVFEKKNIQISLKNNKNIITENNQTKNWGTSIHYCNLKINNIKIRDYLKKIDTKIDGFGMAFVKQKNAGPISNDIIQDIDNRFKHVNHK